MVSARFEGRGIIVTGGEGAIGHATALRLVEEGGRVAIIDIHPPSDISDGVELRLATDVSDEAAVADACARVMDRFGRLDVIVNAAGVALHRPIVDLTQADWLAHLSVNLLGAVNFTANALRLMTAGGAIVNVASIHAERTSSLRAPYSAGKAALTAFTRSSAIEGRGRAIRANAVLPGAIDTPMLRSSPKRSAERSEIPVGSPRDVAAAICFLACDEARFITGATLVVDGGRLAEL